MWVTVLCLFRYPIAWGCIIHRFLKNEGCQWANMWCSAKDMLESSMSGRQRDLAVDYKHLATISWAINSPWAPGKAVWQIRSFDVHMTREERNALWSNSCPHNPTHTQSEGWGLGCRVDKRQAVSHLNDKLLTHPSWGHSTLSLSRLDTKPKGHPTPLVLFLQAVETFHSRYSNHLDPYSEFLWCCMSSAFF